MKKGEMFSQNGKTYEVLQDGLDFVHNQKACIRPQGEKRCIPLEKALKSNLIREAGQSEDSRKEETNPQLPFYESGTIHKIITLYEKIIEPVKATDGSTNVSNGARSLFYMPVDQLRTQVFLAHGLIYPAIWDKANGSSDFDDIQRHAPTVLTLFAAPQPINKNQHLLGILLLPEEVKAYIGTSAILRYPLPLPISRLVSIGISPEQGDLNRYIAGWIKPDVPVPRHLFSIAPAVYRGADGAVEGITQDYGIQSKELEDSINKFDRYMGLVAFLRNADRYFSVKTCCYADYPEEYFGLFAAITGDASFNPHKHSHVDTLLLSLLDREDGLSEVAKNIRSLVIANDAFIEKERARTLAMEIYKTTGEQEEVGQAFKNLFAGDYRSAIQVLRQAKFPYEAGVLAALFKYSSRQSNDHRNIKQKIHEDWLNPRQIVPILGALGAYYGYTALDAKETSLYAVHPLLKPFVEQNPEIKFYMQTVFELQLIEAIYQWAFYQRLPDKNMLRLYDKPPISAVPMASGKPGRLVNDRSYRVCDLFVRRFEITIIGKIIHYIKSTKDDSVDERSELGRCLLAQCFFLADEFELSRKRGQDILHFRISKDRLADLIESGQITVNSRIIEIAIEEDSKKSGL
ncbi:MAG TPA: hypothetical protein PLN83_12535 [Syntrophorhabdus sp.]|nr:hypothetical protein [Syntrophorhabdus sp.]